MNVPHFPELIDIIDEVLKQLKNDFSTLFNCLLINRIWCIRTVPLLYENPFDYIYKYHNNINIKYSITWTLILCFDEMELSYFNVSEIYSSKSCKNYREIDAEYKPLFEYP